ncbi:Phage tail length tape-measure protein [Pseudomonas chlororaphis subsp. aureofaciens]|uniref:phage tail tape measure protein n=1 Tax=Pseudomonas chlororaphis TaxID=587753 RepID=UPI000F584FD7|nr:phage tail tape measure protein [Pseudomonas chlororaphis]AZD84748.1 Phage tail length tape-measure protein [Pseudomonas chlororaphis subsp. aureofaciens]
MANDLKLRVLLNAIDKATGPLRSIDKSSIGAARALKEARDSLKVLNAQQSDISAWRTQRAAAEQTEQALGAARDKVRQLSQQFAAAGVPTKAMAKDFKAAVREAQRLKQEHQAQGEKLQGLRSKLYSAGISTKNLGEHERQLREQISSTNAKISEQGRRLQALNAQQRRLAAERNKLERTQGVAGNMATSGAAGLGTGYALSRPLKAAVDAFAPAENAATQLKVSMMAPDGSVSAEFEKMSTLATQLGDRLPGTTADFQEMMTMLRRQGLTATNILGGTGEAAAYLGVQLQMPVTAAAEFAAKMQDATRTSEKDMMSLMDTIQRTFYLGVESDNMLQGFSKISPVMDIIKKQGLEASKVLTPLLVMMDQTSMEGGAAGNAFRKIFQGAMANGKIQRAMSDLKAERGISLKLDFTDGKGEFGGIEKMYAQLEKLKGLNTEVRLDLIKNMFGDDSETITTLNTMMTKGIAGYREIEGKMQSQADLRTRVNVQLSTLANVLEAAQGSWTNAMAEVGAVMAPELKELIQSLGELANRIGAWVKKNPELARQIAKTVAGIAVLTAVMGGLSIGLASILGPFAMIRYAMVLFGIKGSGALSLITGGVRTLAKALGGPLITALRTVSIAMWGLARNPIVLVVAAVVAALALGAYLIYKNWDKVKAYFANAWAEIKAGFNGGVGGILTVLANFSPIGLIYQAFSKVMSYLGIDLPNRFTEFGNMIVNGLVNGLTAGMGQIKGAITSIGDSTIGWFKEKLGIHSPSRVFAELGGFTMAGLTQGLEDGEKGSLNAMQRITQQLTAAGAVTLQAPALPAPLAPAAKPNEHGPVSMILDLGKQLAAGALAVGSVALPSLTIDERPPISPTSSAAYDSHDTYEINIHATPGMDPMAIGRAVRAELARIESEKGARRRSKLSDLE